MCLLCRYARSTGGWTVEITRARSPDDLEDQLKCRRRRAEEINGGKVIRVVCGYMRLLTFFLRENARVQISGLINVYRLIDEGN